jgi:hypothetical protein
VAGRTIDDADNGPCLSTAASPGILVIWDGGVQELHWGIRIAGGWTTLWVALGSWVVVFPARSRSLSAGYDFHDELSIS